MDRLTGIEIFVRAVGLGSLSAAARYTRLSPTMATKHLNALEARLGTTLLHRTTRKLQLTEAGAAYLETAERLLEELALAESDVYERSSSIKGLLRVSAPVTFGVKYIAELAAEFQSLHPDVIVDLGLSDRYVDLIEERWDMAVRIGILADSSLIARKLGNADLCICASPSYLSARGIPKTTGDLRAHDCLGYTAHQQRGICEWRFGRQGDKPVLVKAGVHANNGEALVQAAIAGAGLVYGPRFIAVTGLESGALVEIHLDIELRDLGGIYAITHPDRRPATKTRAWIDFLASRLPLLLDNRTGS